MIFPASSFHIPCRGPYCLKFESASNLIALSKEKALVGDFLEIVTSLKTFVWNSSHQLSWRKKPSKMFLNRIDLPEQILYLCVVLFHLSTIYFHLPNISANLHVVRSWPELITIEHTSYLIQRSILDLAPRLGLAHHVIILSCITYKRWTHLKMEHNIDF